MTTTKYHKEELSMKANRIMHLFSKVVKYLSVGALGAFIAVAIEYGWNAWFIAGVIVAALNFALYLATDIYLTREEANA